jgi:outer membrane protein OmpA-like peptidoglycan-associated protein
VNSILEKAGLQLNFRLHDRWDFYIEGEALALPEHFDRHLGGDQTQDLLVNAKAGFTYRINFRHFIKAPLIDQDQLDALNNEINDLRNRQPVVCPPVTPCPPPPAPVVVEKAKDVELDPVFFTIDSYVVRDNQLLSVAKAAQYLIDNPDARLEVAAYADKNTGNPKHNWTLSNNRVKAVVRVLTNKFGIDKSRLTTSFYGDTVQPYDEANYTKNRVAIFIK